MSADRSKGGKGTGGLSRRGALVGAASLAGLGLTKAALAKPLAEVLSTKKLRAGINPTLVPFGVFNQQNQIDGFDADIAREIARQMRVELEIVQVGSPDRIPFLQADRIDIVLGAITRTVERALVIDYTIPLHTQSVVVLTKESGTAVPIAKPADLDNPAVRLVQVRGERSRSLLRRHRAARRSLPTLGPALLLQDRAHTLSLLHLVLAIIVGTLRLGVIVLERIQTSSGDLRARWGLRGEKSAWIGGGLHRVGE